MTNRLHDDKGRSSELWLTTIKGCKCVWLTATLFVGHIPLLWVGTCAQHPDPQRLIPESWHDYD